MMKIACGLLLLLAGLLVWRERQKRKTAEARMEKLSEDINHFVIYQDNPLEETLEEGALYNLYNQIAKLETQYLYSIRAQKKREEEWNHFIENMAHQMKTAVTALQLRLDMAMLRTVTEEERLALSKSQECMERLIDEIERVLKSSQLAAGKVRMMYEKKNLYQLAGECKERLREIAKQRGVGIVLCGEKNLTACVDEFWMIQALENIMKNAVEHTPEGGCVTLSTENHRSSLKILIEDEGTGIENDQLSEIFRRFGRGRTDKAGYGIGLSMARDIVQAHHGEITAGNREEKGAWFQIVIPVLEGTAPYEREKKEEKRNEEFPE